MGNVVVLAKFESEDFPMAVEFRRGRLYMALVLVIPECVPIDLYGMMRKYCPMGQDTVIYLTRIPAVFIGTAFQVPVDSGIATLAFWAHEALPRCEGDGIKHVMWVIRDSIRNQLVRGHDCCGPTGALFEKVGVEGQPSWLRLSFQLAQVRATIGAADPSLVINLRALFTTSVAHRSKSLRAVIWRRGRHRGTLWSPPTLLSEVDLLETKLEDYMFTVHLRPYGRDMEMSGDVVSMRDGAR